MKYFIFITIVIIATNVSIYSQIEIKQLNSKNNIQIQENDLITFRRIKSMSVTTDGKCIALIDGSRQFIALYNNKGKLLNYFYTKDSLNQYLINQDERYFNTVSSKNFSLLKNENAQELGLDCTNIINDFLSSSFINDSLLLIGGTMRAFMIDSSAFYNKIEVSIDNNISNNLKKNNIILNNIGCFYIFNKNLNLIYATPIEATSYEYSLGNLVYPYDDSTFIVTVSNYSAQSNDSLTLFSLFDYKGKHIKLLQNLPDDYINYTFKYGLINSIEMCNIGTNYYWATMYDYKIRTLYDTSSFPIIGFDSSNILSWNKFRDEYEINNNSQNIGRKKIDIHYSIININKWNKNLIGIFIYNNDSKKYFIQLYETNGKLIKQYEIMPAENQMILKVAFVDKINSIYAITKDNNYYYITIYEL